MVCDLKIEFELGWWENSTLQGLFSNAEFTVVMQMSAVGGVVMVMVVVVVVIIHPYKPTICSFLINYNSPSH